MIGRVQLTLAVALLCWSLAAPLPAQVPATPESTVVSSPGYDGRPTDPSQPVMLKIITPAPSEILDTGTVDIFLQLTNYVLAKGGNRVRVILDNESPVELDNIHSPVTFRNLVEGGHTVRALVAAPNGVSLTNKESFAMVYFFVKSRDYQNYINPELPFLTVGAPLSGPIHPDPMGRVWIDFRAVNAPLGAGGGYTIRYTCNNVQSFIDKPLFFPGMKPGQYTLTLELLTTDQQPVVGPMNKVTRKFEVLRVATAAATADDDSDPAHKPAETKPPETTVKGTPSSLD